MSSQCVHAGPGVDDWRYDPAYWDTPEDGQGDCLICGARGDCDHNTAKQCGACFRILWTAQEHFRGVCQACRVAGLRSYLNGLELTQ